MKRKIMEIVTMKSAIRWGWHVGCAACVVVLSAAPATAHFGVILPSDDIINQQDTKKIFLEAKFIHPMEGQYMEMEKPKRFFVQSRGKAEDLTGGLAADKGKSTDQQEAFTFWKTAYDIRRPGDYTFALEPAPYWEPAEDVYIVHYTKVCVNALGREAGWDEPVGLETEIIPLTRPYGLWAGNLFTGQVLLHGKPVSFAEVEVEYLNEAAVDGALVPPSDPFVTQVVKADGNGVFSYSMPKAGWWGFAALNEASWTLPKDGVAKKVEIGAVYWVKATPLQ